MAGTLHWDALRLFGDITTGLRKAGAAGDVASIGVDTWGVDFGAARRARAAAREPGPLPRRADRRHGRARVLAGAQGRDLRHDRHPVHGHQHRLPAAGDGERGRSAPAARRPAADDGRPVRPLPVRRQRGRVHARVDQPGPRRPRPRLGTPDAGAPRHPDRAAARDRGARDRRRRPHRRPRRRARPRRRPRRPAGLARHGVGRRGHAARLRVHGLPLVRDLVADRPRGPAARDQRRDAGREPDQRGRRRRHHPAAAQRRGAVAGPGEPSRAVAGPARPRPTRSSPGSPRRRPPSPRSSIPTTSASCARATCRRGSASSAPRPASPSPPTPPR